MMDNERGSTTFDWQHDRVRSGHVTARISGQEKAVLRLLVAADGRVCEREELMDAIWGTRAAHMDDLYLTQLVYRVRKALKPLGLCERIVTMPRMGYRFDAEGLRAPDDASSSDAAALPGHAAPKRGLRAWLARCRPGRQRAGENSRPPAAPPVAAGMPVIHARLGTVNFAGTTAHLTGFERALLEAFVERPDTTLERHELILRIWGADDHVDVHRLTRLVSRLRRSLQPLGLAQRIVHIPGVGYQFCTTDDPPDALQDATGDPHDATGATGATSRRGRSAGSRRLTPRGAAMLAGAVLLILANCRLAPATEPGSRSADSLQCTRKYVHDVFVRHVAASVSMREQGSLPQAVNEAWGGIIEDLHAAGCRSVTAGPGERAWGLTGS
jgi:DNA-binding winged helix-turn-helix (wHTH) protein